MRPALWLAAVLALVPLSGHAADLDPAAARAVKARAVDNYIRPAYRDFHAKASTLAAETEKLCTAPTAAGLTQVQARFAAVVTSWSRIDFLRLGPVMAESRLERVLYYPDRKSTGLKQVQALLAKPDEAILDAATFKNRSVAMQGLGAFEYTFYGAYPEGLVAERNTFRCRYGLAIARNVEGIAGELQAAWDAPGGIADDWKNPSAANPAFRDEKEAISALIGIAVHGIEMVRDQRIRHFYKGGDAKVTPKQALFWRSGLTMTAIGGNLDGLRDLWKASDFAALMDEESGSLAEAVTFDLNAAETALARLDPPSADRLGDKKYRAKLDFIDFNLKDAVSRIDTDIGGAVGLGAGFSFGDGD